MKRQAIVSFILVLLFLVSVANAPNEPSSTHYSRSQSHEPPATQWNMTYGGVGEDGAGSVRQTTDGGYIVAGYTMSSGSADFWLVKTDASANMIWNRTYGGGGNDAAKSVRQTTDGGYIVAGYTTSSGSGSVDLWLVKTDASGNMIWDQTFGGNGTDVAEYVQQTTDGGYVVAGQTKSFGEGSYDFWLVKTNANGNMIWNQTYGGGASDLGGPAQQTTDGGYIMTGCTFSFGEGSGDAWLVKTDASGRMVWNQTYGGPEFSTMCCVQQTTDGGYAMAGCTHSFGNDNGTADFWLVKTDASGNMIWDQTYGGVLDDEALCVRQTTDGGYAVAGYTMSSGSGSSDFWLVKVAPESSPHAPDVTISNVSASKTVVGQGFSTGVDITVADQGSYPETFNVTARADAVGISDGLVGYWSFDEGSGTTAFDRSGNHNDGTIYGATWTDERFGKALSFDGKDDCVVVPGSASLKVSDAITIATWVKLEQVPAEAYGFIIGGGYSYVAYAYVSDPAGVRFNFGTCTAPGIGYDLQQENWKAYGVDLPYLPYNQSYYVVWMYDSSGYTAIYVNGNLYANTTLMSGKMYIFDSKVTINDDAKLHKGIIDEVRIYNRTLSEQEIRAFAGSGVIHTQTVSLESGASTTITFNWTTIGFAKGNYTISAYAEPVPGETDTADNNFTSGKVTLSIPGDINGDGRVDILDISMAAKAYSSRLGEQRFEPNADLNEDGIVNILDISSIAREYGRTG